MFGRLGMPMPRHRAPARQPVPGAAADPSADVDRQPRHQQASEPCTRRLGGAAGGGFVGVLDRPAAQARAHAGSLLRNRCLHDGRVGPAGARLGSRRRSVLCSTGSRRVVAYGHRTGRAGRANRERRGGYVPDHGRLHGSPGTMGSTLPGPVAVGASPVGDAHPRRSRRPGETFRSWRVDAGAAGGAMFRAVDVRHRRGRGGHAGVRGCIHSNGGRTAAIMVVTVPSLR